MRLFLAYGFMIDSIIENKYKLLEYFELKLGQDEF